MAGGGELVLAGAKEKKVDPVAEVGEADARARAAERARICRLRHAMKKRNAATQRGIAMKNASPLDSLDPSPPPPSPAPAPPPRRFV